MVALRVAVVLLCVAVVAWPVGRAMVVGMRTGPLPHSDSTSSVARAAHPVRFWALMALFLAMLALLGYGASLGLQRALA